MLNSAWVDRRVKWIFTLPAVAFVVVMMVFPVVYTLRLSFTEWSGGARGPLWVGISNYVTLLFHDSRFIDAVWRTIVFTVGAVALELVIGLGIALLLNRPFRGQKIVRTVILIPLVATPVAIGMAWLLILEPTIGFANEFLSWLHLPPQPWLASESQALWTVMLVDVWQWTPMITLIALAGLGTIPEEPLEAAMVDGANAWRRFRSITLPLLAPTLVGAVLLRSIDALKTFDILYTMTQGGPGYATETLNVYAYVQGFQYFQFGMVSALLVLFFILVLAVSMVTAKARDRWGENLA